MQQFTEHQVDGVVVVTAIGAVDMLTAPQLHHVITAALASNPTSLIIDMSQVDFLGSAGMQILMATRDRLNPGTRFAVVAEGPATSRPLKITGIADFIDLCPSLDVALTNFAQPSASKF